MLKIKKRTVNKLLTLEDFMKLKKDGGYFEDTRYKAKSINFSFLFGAVAMSFANRELDLRWTDAEAQQYIDDNQIGYLRKKMMDRFPTETDRKWNLMACAQSIRDKFFAAYPGLMGRIERERQFATEHGYIRSWHGACRRSPELFLAEKNEKGNLCGDDRKYHGKSISTLLNVAANTSIQNFEAVFVMKSISEIMRIFKERGMKTRPFCSVHDSIDFYLHKDEVDEFKEILMEVCTRAAVKESFDMPQEIDIDVANLMEGDYYKGGQPIGNYLTK
jgi:DNA polymerase I-like protein with 3'-5' exonuclease and polymerase domains